MTAVDSQRVADADGMIAAIRPRPWRNDHLSFTRSGSSRTVKVTLVDR